MTDKVKAKIIELVPEIMDLKYGCFVLKKRAHGYHRYLILERSYVSRINATVYTLFDEDDGGISTEDGLTIEKYKILGRPIQLNDVLRAIDMPVKYYSGVKTPTIKIDVVRLLAIWNLAEHFDNQTPETRSFIGSLLGVTDDIVT